VGKLFYTTSTKSIRKNGKNKDVKAGTSYHRGGGKGRRRGKDLRYNMHSSSVMVYIRVSQ